MTYITVKQSPHIHQMTLDELFDSTYEESVFNPSTSSTYTYAVESVSKKVLKKINIHDLIIKLDIFNQKYEELREKPRKSLYREFYIPKKSGGLRKIDAPEPELSEALRDLKAIFEEDFHALYHTSAFAYVKHRSTLDAVKRHQMNKSRWFGKYDLSNFFGSCTPEFVMKQLSMIFPFSEVIKNEIGKEELQKALDLAFLDGGLPQGTPLSPMLTNIIMIPIDHILSNTLRNYKKQSYVYTRYADDFLVSSEYNFSFREIENLIRDTLASFGAPFQIKPQKTRYGSSAGANWNLGVMLNAKNEITVGHKKKRAFQAMLHNFIRDTQNGNRWSLGDIQVLEGYRSYYRMVEKDTIDAIVNHISEKHGVDVVAMIKEQLKA